eukprot:CAMPEP_0194500052 /NCGR_PEP_ID=MMETSP0253-20130528/16150_1 /TAXON_ID=2966 /ORGANISM="Noctiluca scintillans" /LENGTH=139 /DNA_ID=CAMNT_0039341863 /DNA_START=45 /DNA_END=464 /DNA_ORIENTATION=+
MDRRTQLTGVSLSASPGINEDIGGVACSEALDEGCVDSHYVCKEEGTPYKLFDVSLDRTHGKRMGLAVRQDLDLKLLQIMSVEGGDSAATDWNSANPEVALQQGDYIISVNFRTDMAGIVLECKKTQVLRITLQRAVQP